MWLRSDNSAGVDPAILAAMAACNEGDATSYGGDALSLQLNDAFSALFEAPVQVFAVPSGTAGNALALASLAGSFDAILCHDNAHAFGNEAGATETFSGGARFIPVAGERGCIDPATVLRTIVRAKAAAPTSYAPRALTVTQLTEAGTAYAPERLQALGAVAREHGLRFHMDGARLANALATLKCSPAAITWKVGVDVLSFGATKNGTMCADAVVFFNNAFAEDFKLRLKRGGHALSKTRFLAAQLLAYIEGDRWLANARHANEVAKAIAAALRRVPTAEIVHPVDGNIVFAALDAATVRCMSAAGLELRSKGMLDDGREVFRLVTSFRSDPDEAVRLGKILAA